MDHDVKRQSSTDYFNAHFWRAFVFSFVQWSVLLAILRTVLQSVSEPIRDGVFTVGLIIFFGPVILIFIGFVLLFRI